MREADQLLRIAGNSRDPKEHFAIAEHADPSIVANLALNEHVAADAIERAIAHHSELVSAFRSHANAPSWLIESGPLVETASRSIDNYGHRFVDHESVINHLSERQLFLQKVWDDSVTVGDAMRDMYEGDLNRE